MSVRNLIVENFDQLVDSALNELSNRYEHNECSFEEKENLRRRAVERLPDGYEYQVNAFRPRSKSKFKLCFSSKDVKIDNLEGWLIEFQSINKVTLKVKVKKKATKGYLLQHYYRCQHNTRNLSLSKDPQRKLSLNPTARVKNTNCPFQLIVKVTHCDVCTIDIDWDHNHATDNLEASNFKELSSDCVHKVHSLFEAGETPSTARQKFLRELKSMCKDEIDFHIKKADRSITPRQRDFRHIYEQYGKQKFGGKNEEMFEKLAEKIELYKTKNKEASIDYQMYGGDAVPLLIAIVTPLMNRVHSEVQQCGELIFVDSTSNTEEHNLKVFLLCTHSVAGALPCGLLITSDEKEATLKRGFEMLRNILPESAFFSSGKSVGPKTMITDNCKEERDALKSTWPSVTVLLCTFHMLQQTWRWLTDKNHGVMQGDRPHILSKFKEALFANSQELFEKLYISLLSDKIVQNYDKAVRYFSELYVDREAFALCFRSSLLVRGNQTNNFVESQFLVLKDIILRRTKEYNVVALLDKIVVDLEDHYKTKLLSIADGSYDGHFRRRFVGRGKTSKCGGQGYTTPNEDERRNFLESVKQFPNDIFEVKSLKSSGTRFVLLKLLTVIMSTQCVHLFIILDNKSMSNNLLKHFGDISSSNVTPSNFT